MSPDPAPLDLDEFAEQFMAAIGGGKADLAKAIERVRQTSPTLYLLLIARMVRDYDC